MDQQFNAADICSDGLCSIKPTDLLMCEGANHSWNVRGGTNAVWGPWSTRMESLFSYKPDANDKLATSIIANADGDYDFAVTGLDNKAFKYRLFVYDLDGQKVVSEQTHYIWQFCRHSQCALRAEGLSLKPSTRYLWTVKAGFFNKPEKHTKRHQWIRWGSWEPATVFSVEGAQ